MEQTIRDHIKEHEFKHNPDIRTLNTVVFGENNDDGLVTDVLHLKDCTNTIKNTLGKIESYAKWLILLVFGAIILAGLDIVIS